MSAQNIAQWLPSVEDLEASLKRYLKGQDHAIAEVSKKWSAFRTGFKNFSERGTRRPIAVLLCVGPSGTGKTSLGKELSRIFYGNPEAAPIINLSGYQERHTVSRLRGSPPGYIGYGDPPELSRQKLYARIPGFKQEQESKTREKPVSQITGMSIGDFLKHQELLHHLQEQNLGLTLGELDLIKKAIENFREELTAIGKEEKSSGKLSEHQEKKRAHIQKRIALMETRQKILFLNYCQAVSTEARAESEEKAAAKSPESQNGHTALTESEKSSTEETANGREGKPSEPVLIVILDEIDEAHPDVINYLADVFEEGKASLMTEEVMDFSRTIFILTSNIGEKYLSLELQNRDKTIGMAPGKDRLTNITTIVKKELSKVFGPRFLNRIDKVITFRDISDEKDLLDILELRIEEFVIGMERLLIKLVVADGVREFIVARAKERPVEQARGLQDEFRRLVEEPLSNLYQKGKIKRGQVISVCLDKDGNKVRFKTTQARPPKAA